MTNKIVAIQGDHPSKLKPLTDTSIFLAVEAQRLKYKIFYYEPKNLSIINDKVIANGYYIEFNYSDKRFFKILHQQKLELTKCKYILIRQDPPFNLEYISTTYILDKIKNKVKIINNPTSIRNISEKLYSTSFQKYMPDTIFTKDMNEIHKFFSKNKQIIIKLKSDKKYSTITWLPNKNYLNTNSVFNGPWIKGLNNMIGALSFNRRIIR